MMQRDRRPGIKDQPQKVAQAIKHWTRTEVGLRANRPFRFCTMHWGADTANSVQPGDDPQADPSRSIENYITQGMPNAQDVPLHSHDFYEIAIIRHGCARHQAGVGETRLQRGDIVVIEPGASHAFLAIEKLFKTNIYLEPSWFFDDLHLLWWEEGLVRDLLANALFKRPARRGLYQLKLAESEISQCERELDDMACEALQARPSLIAFHGGFLKILNVLNTAFKREDLFQSMPLVPEVWAAAEAMEELIRHGQPLDINRIARQLHMTNKNLDRIFLDGAGLSPTAFFQQRRIHYSLRLLMNPQASIADIACTLGFADQAHFSRFFKRYVGTSPNSYRQAHQAASALARPVRVDPQ